jgi:prefoldin beta subunit
MSENSDSVNDLKFLEHNLQQFLAQKQALQIELNEIINALNELENSDEEVYRVLGPVMIKSEKSRLRPELEERKRLLDSRISSVEKQEELITKKIIDERKKYLDGKSSKK